MSLLGFIGELQEAPAKESTVASPPIFWPKHLPNIAPDVSWMRLEKRLFFFNVSYELIMRSISLLFMIERNTRKRWVMQKISDSRICPECSQSFFLTVLPPGCEVSLTEKSLALSPWVSCSSAADRQSWCTHITDLPSGTECSTDLEVSAMAKTSSFAHAINLTGIKYSKLFRSLRGFWPYLKIKTEMLFVVMMKFK